MGLQPGEILDGKYRIVRLVGEGGMGAVYEGENTRIKRRVAIKVLHANVAEKKDVVQRFEREAQAAGRIGSEHIVEVLDLGNLPSGERFMVMEYLEGEDLTSRIKGRKRLTPSQAVPLLHQVLEGLAAAHDAGIIHRDLKPDNIFILKTKAGRADFVKILDFGVSKFSALDSDMSMTKTGAVMGTPYYMSPEQAKGGKIDQRSDLYALGVVLYQAVTGRVPFNASSFNELLFKIALEQPDPIEDIVPDCPRNFIAIVNKAMAREADQRYQSAREFQQALSNWQAQAAPGGTMPLSAVPDMRQPMASAPMMEPSNPGMAQSDPGMYQSHPSHPGMMASQTGPHAAQTGAHPAQGQLGASHSPLAITSHGKPRNSGLMVALVAAVVGILGFGALGAYMLTRSPDSQAAPAQTGGPEETAEPEETAAPEETTEAETDEDAEDDEKDDDEKDEAADTAASADTAEPKETAKPVAPPPPAPVPRPVALPKPKPPPPPPEPKPTPTPQPGRSIKTEL